MMPWAIQGCQIRKKKAEDYEWGSANASILGTKKAIPQGWIVFLEQ